MMRHRGIAVGLAGCLGIVAPATGGAEPQDRLGDTVLDQALRESGWEVRRAEGGGLLLSPPQAPHRDVQASQEAGAGRDEPHRNVQASQEAGAGRDEARGITEATEQQTPSAVGAGGTALGTRPDWDRLRGLGWRVEQGADGSTLLYPPVPPAAPGPTIAPVAEPEKALDTLLQERGWRVERNAQGALVLHPRGLATVRPAVTPAPGAETAPVRDATIALPVDRWAEAKIIAEAWLAEHGAPGWRVGKIRQVHRVYMISIVDAGRPPQVVHQIAITSGNGLVVVLN